MFLVSEKFHLPVSLCTHTRNKSRFPETYKILRLWRKPYIFLDSWQNYWEVLTRVLVTTVSINKTGVSRRFLTCHWVMTYLISHQVDMFTAIFLLINIVRFFFFFQIYLETFWISFCFSYYYCQNFSQTQPRTRTRTRRTRKQTDWSWLYEDSMTQFPHSNKKQS